MADSLEETRAQSVTYCSEFAFLPSSVPACTERSLKPGGYGLDGVNTGGGLVLAHGVGKGVPNAHSEGCTPFSFFFSVFCALAPSCPMRLLH